MATAGQSSTSFALSAKDTKAGASVGTLDAAGTGEGGVPLGRASSLAKWMTVQKTNRRLHPLTQ